MLAGGRRLGTERSWEILLPELGAWQGSRAKAQLLGGSAKSSWTCKLTALHSPWHAREHRPSGPRSTAPPSLSHQVSLLPIHPVPSHRTPFPKGSCNPSVTARTHASHAMPPQGSPCPTHITIHPGCSSDPSLGRPQPRTSPPALSELQQFPSPMGFPGSKH